MTERTSKQARWDRFDRLEAVAYRDRLGYGGDVHRIDPRILGGGETGAQPPGGRPSHRDTSGSPHTLKQAA